MVAKITFPKNIQAALNYNEKKVQNGTAECLYASNFLREAKDMNFYHKLNGFENLNILNRRAITKTLHVSLNFDPREKISDDNLITIASVYMQKIGFGQQPFIIYKHEDAGHPHIHIVSNTIKEDGSRINTHNLGRNQSEKARKEIENLYSLIKAERNQQSVASRVKAVDAEKAIYGKHETKRSISNVVSEVFNQFKFTSLPEFNAALKQFNVIADRGKEEGRIYQNRGLMYRILDTAGNKVGVPIKASSISCKPTLDNLEKKFTTNDTLRESQKQRTKNIIDDCLQLATGTMKNFVTALEQMQVYAVLRQNSDGRIYGITFVDNQTKCVFNGSDLGKSYSASSLQTRLITGKENPHQQNEAISDHPSDSSVKETRIQKLFEKSIQPTLKKEGIMDILLSAIEQFDNTPSGLLKKKRKKKKTHNL